MKTLTVRQGETIYLLYNLTPQRLSELQNDSGKLTTYFNHCLKTGINVCVQENEGNPSTSTTDLISSTSDSLNTTTAKFKFSFLCGTFEKKNFIYAIKFAKHPWHYFDELDSISSQHGSLPASMDSLIGGMNKIRSIDVNLNEVQSRNYYDNGKFIFRDKELKTYMELANKQSNENQPSASKSSHKSTTRLVFASGRTNPLLFLNDFEKCRDLKTDKDKMYKIRHFVDKCHKAEFARLYFSSDWQTVRSVFLKMYSLSFAENKKRELQIDFNEATSLRSFIERKLMSLSTFTTLPFINQVEMVMNDLPIEISCLFITNEKMTSDKDEILDFCDCIQDLVGTMRETTKEPSTNDQESSQPSNQIEIESSQQSNQMEIVELNESEESESVSMQIDDSPQSSHGRGRGRAKDVTRGVTKSAIAKRGRGRPSKKLKAIPEDTESSNYDFLAQMDNSSRSSWSDK